MRRQLLGDHRAHGDRSGLRAPRASDGRAGPLAALAVQGRQGCSDRRALGGGGSEEPSGALGLSAPGCRLAQHLQAARDSQPVAKVRPDPEALAGEVLRLVEVASPQSHAPQREERAADAPPVAEVAPAHRTLVSTTQSCSPIKQPKGVATAGYYPTVSCLRHDPTTGHTTVSLEQLVFRAASAPEP